MSPPEEIKLAEIEESTPQSREARELREETEEISRFTIHYFGRQSY